MIQEQFWLTNQIQPESSAYNIPSVFRINGLLNIAALEQGINHVIERHESLRTTFSSEQGKLKRTIASSLTVNLRTTDISHLVEKEQPTKQDELIHAEITQAFNLSSGPLLRAHVLQLSRQEFILVIVMHHIITDLKSKELFAAELTALYNAMSMDSPLPEFDPPVQYSNYVSWQKEWSCSQNATDMLTFWRKELEEQSPLLNLPFDFPRPPMITSRGTAQWFEL
ncbi:MAG: hypothetical protein D3908_00660, partial [Candidatus Electrothrix sp. AUS4]|nr:hypothetical protein [Candidatus Electrothrix sp. AUS4]